LPTWLITGCSTGLGHDLARAVLESGENVVLTGRGPGALQALAEAHPETAVSLPLDVRDPSQIRHAVRKAEERFGSIDVLVNNAGHGYRAAVEEGEIEDVKDLFDTNFFGPVNLIKAVLPGMRREGRGTIVNISSICCVAKRSRVGLLLSYQVCPRGPFGRATTRSRTPRNKGYCR
jgi:NAD(P)-dependent dehydrogenase (short-subunit alcohol dehydrogenase family)